jgi:large subunit ribosomal protein L6
MSRLGKLPIQLPSGVEARMSGKKLEVKGPKGQLELVIPKLVKVDIADGVITVSISDTESKKERAFWGLFRSLVNNMVVGVSEGFSKQLEVVGVGYRVSASGNKLTLNVGYSQPVEFNIPEGLSVATEGNTITVSGIDKQAVGETAARIRKVRKPEPYKGKGIKYADEVIQRKEGKSASKKS